MDHPGLLKSSKQETKVGVKLGAPKLLPPLLLQNYQNILVHLQQRTIDRFELSEIKGHLVEVSKDQLGSWFVQNKLRTASLEEKNEVFLELVPHALDLMKNRFGNLVIQKFFQHGQDLQRKILVDEFVGRVYDLSMNRNACRVIQRALGIVDVEQKIRIVSELNPVVHRCLFDGSAKHVIYKCVKCVPREQNAVIFSACINQTAKLLKCDQGASIIEFMLEHGKPEDRTKIIENLSGKIVELSVHKYRSKIIRDCLKFGNHSDRRHIINEILGSTDEKQLLWFYERWMPWYRRYWNVTRPGFVLILSHNLYGCRVIEMALELSDMHLKIRIVRELEKNINMCIYDPNANHAIQKCIQFVPEEDIALIVTTCLDQIDKLANHTPGGFIIERLLKYCKNPMTQTRLIDGIVSSILILANNPYGNHIVQHIFMNGKPEDQSRIVEKFRGSIVRMCQHKFASNVIRYCVILSSRGDRKLIVNEIIGSTGGNEPLQTIMQYQCGQHIVKVALASCDDEQVRMILSRIENFDPDNSFLRRYKGNRVNNLAVVGDTNSLADNNN